MDDIEKVKSKTDIVDVIGQHVTLKKAGTNFKGLCPFHGEKSPSFVVSAERQIFHCFGCGKGGDVLTFVEEYEKMDFGEALKLLAEKAGIKLTMSNYRTENEKKKEEIYTLNSLAASFYNYLLLDHVVGKAALEYLTVTRGVPLPLIKKFNLGFAPRTGSPLIQFLMRKKGYKAQEIVDAGLASLREGRFYDFFRDRVMFPIYDTRDNIIAFSGRALENTTLPKYVNTRETHVYKKGDTLFGLNFAKEAIKAEGKVIVVEGEFDVISSFHEGIKNIVAVKGTALTENQIRVLKRFAPKITFCFDTDPAGTSAQRRSIELIEREGIAASVIIPPHGKDPDELIREDPIAFKKAIKDDVNIYDFIIDTSVAGLDIRSSEGKKQITEKALPILSQIDNEVVKEHYLKKLANILNISLESLLRQAEKSVGPRPQAVSAPISLPKMSREERSEEFLLSLLLQAKNPKEACLKVEDIVSKIEFFTPAYNRLFNHLRDFCHSDHEFVVSDMVKTLPPELIDTFDRCFLAPLPPFEKDTDYMKELERTAQEVKLLSIKSKLREVASLLKEKEGSASEEELEALQQEFKRLTELFS